MVTWQGLNKALREEVDECVKRERVPRQTAEHRVEELKKEMEELRGVVKSLLREKLDEDLPRVSVSYKTELPVAIVANGHEVIQSCEVDELRTEEGSHPVGSTVVREVSVVRPEPPGLEESKTTSFKTVIDVPEDMQEACAEEGVHEAFKEAVKACEVRWATETRQLVIVSAREDTSNRVAVLKEMHLQCLRVKQLVRQSNVKAARRLEIAREAMDRRGLRKDVVPVPKALIGKIIGRSGKVMQDLVNISGVVRVRIPPDDEDQVSSDVGRIPIMVVGSMESLRDFWMLVECRVGYLREIQQLRLDRQRINKEVRNTRWRPPATQQDVRTRRVPPRSDRADGRRGSASGSSTGRMTVRDRSSCETLKESDSGQTVGPMRTDDRTNRESRSVGERSGDETHSRRVVTKQCLMTQTDGNWRVKVNDRYVDRWGRGRPNVERRPYDSWNRFSRPVGQGVMSARSRDPGVRLCVQPHKFEQRGGVCGVMTAVSARGRCVGVPGQPYKHFHCPDRCRILKDHNDQQRYC
ncbi:uncharacterized protein [Dendrobates tinctorius]|uniref:uncharacterized protein isoform X2 n=1 Tax=Dendrobates tinctorius TaxID=92724 RepID=UPI003CC9F9FA